jgi:gas vesicle protein
MNKVFSFLAGGMCGALVGAVTALLLAPASGDELRSNAVARWDMALQDARMAMEERRVELERQFERMRESGAS